MNPLQSELHRLYLPSAVPHPQSGIPSTALVDAQDRVRSLVLELAGPPDWKVLSRVWRGVQTELDLPAPAIAVSGVDGLQLWFSLAEPIPVPQAHAFLESLRSRFLADIAAKRIRLMPAADASAQRQELHAHPVPALQEQSGNWSAFVAPDLAPVFADTPWLDIPPGEEGQAALLGKLKVMTPPAFDAAWEQLGADTQQVQHAQPSPRTGPVAGPAGGDPKAFLLRIMNDDTVALALRIEAAKALL
ncbi:MAG: hypothetical protein V4505_01945 [Pseudomonadota bacterium]